MDNAAVFREIGKLRQEVQAVASELRKLTSPASTLEAAKKADKLNAVAATFGRRSKEYKQAVREINGLE